MSNISLFDVTNYEINYDKDKYIVKNFSAGCYAADEHRRYLEDKFSKKLEIIDNVDRTMVSFQANKDIRLHSWLKYREGFSSNLVNLLLDHSNLKPDSIILDPFIGSGTTSLVAQINNYSSVGFDILPISKISIEAKNNVFNYEIRTLKNIINTIESMAVPKSFSGYVNFLNITEGAYPDETDRELAYLKYWIDHNNYETHYNNLILLTVLNSLEKLSYTRKDGQYLRWDFRSDKVKKTNQKRKDKGQPPLKTVLDKGPLPKTYNTISNELKKIANDIKFIQENFLSNSSKIDFKLETALKGLPKISENSIDCVITSPPYCNRYDYTRTYALELAFLGYTNESIKELRQTLLTSTVENKSKENLLKNYYISLDKVNTYEKIFFVLENNLTLKEIITALELRLENGEVNNKGILPMVKGYFYELCFIFAEIFRISKNGAKVYFVNDNVRYAGEVVPVDFLSCELAEKLGFEINKIYSIKQLKGNSSQQMKKYGKVPLRKSITEWTVRK
ncbi:DNA methyltransferase [Facklamia languida]